MVLLVRADQAVVIQVHPHIAVERQTCAHADHCGIAIHRHALHGERAVAVGEGQMAVGINVVQVVLPAEARTQFQLLLIRQGERTLGAHTEGRQHHITIVLTALQRRRVTLFGEAFSVQVHVSQIGERLQIHRLQAQIISGLGEHLSGCGIVLGLLFTADVPELQVTFDVDTVPAIGATDGQTQRIDLMAQVRTQVVAVDRRRRMRAAAHAQRAVAITGNETETGIFSDQAIDTGQQATDGAVGVGIVMPAIALAPRTQDLDPGVAAIVGRCASVEQVTLTQTLAHRFTQVTAVVDQHGADRRMDFAGQLLEGLLRRRRIRRQQQGFEQRIASAQTFRRGTDSALVWRKADAGERGLVTTDRQLDAIRRVRQRATEERVIRQHLTEASFNTAGRLQDVVARAEQALHLVGGQQGRAVFQ